MKNYRSLRAISQKEHTEFKVFKRPGDIRNWKVRCVCEAKCNNGWMRRDVDEVAMPIITPLLEGNPIRLMPADQKIVARWATLKVIVAEYDPPGSVSTHHTQRKYLMNHLAPPDGWSVWIGHHIRTPVGKFHWGHFPALILPDAIVSKRRSRKANYYNSSSTSLLIGRLFIHVLHSSHRLLSSSWRFDTPDGGALCRIWPPTGVSLVWPPTSMTARDVDYAVGALKAFMEQAAAKSPSHLPQLTQSRGK